MSADAARASSRHAMRASRGWTERFRKRSTTEISPTPVGTEISHVGEGALFSGGLRSAGRSEQSVLSAYGLTLKSAWILSTNEQLTLDQQFDDIGEDPSVPYVVRAILSHGNDRAGRKLLVSRIGGAA